MLAPQRDVDQFVPKTNKIMKHSPLFLGQILVTFDPSASRIALHGLVVPTLYKFIYNHTSSWDKFGNPGPPISMLAPQRDVDQFVPKTSKMRKHSPLFLGQILVTLDPSASQIALHGLSCPNITQIHIQVYFFLGQSWKACNPCFSDSIS